MEALEEGVSLTVRLRYSEDGDGDGVGDDGDFSGVEGDAICTGGAASNCDDNCPGTENPNQEDRDGDSVGDACDACPDDPAMTEFTIYYEDADNDGYGNPAVSRGSCTEPAGWALNDGDCDDDDALEHPGRTWWEDADGDMYSTGDAASQCERPANHYAGSELTALSGDCDDGDGSIHPGASETCDGRDNDCDGETDNGLSPPLNDLQAGVCAASMKRCGGAGGWLNDYSGIGAYEVEEAGCDDRDNDCDGQVDEGVTTTFYEDADSDGYGNPAVGQEACMAPAGFVTNGEDYDDGDGQIHPGGPEIRIVDSPNGYYWAHELQAAYDNALEGDAIQILAPACAGDLLFNQNKTVALTGDDPGFTNVSGAATILGKVIISDGCVMVKNIVLQ